MSATGTALRIDADACTGCGRCVRTCAAHGVELVGEKPRRAARATEACTLCGMCVESCPFGAISIERPQGAGAGAPQGAGRDVWVFAQVDDAAVAPVAFELLGRGRELADAAGQSLVALLGLGKDAGQPGLLDRAAGQLVACGADEVLFCRDDRLAAHDTDAFATWISALVAERRPDVLLFGATGFGRELAPGVAARVRTGLTADCTVLAIDPETGLLQQTRPAFGGNLMATIVCPGHRPQMASVRPGVLPAPQPDPARRGALTETLLDPAYRPRVRVLERVADRGGAAITDAEVLVVAGRGIGSQKNLPLVRRLAELLGGELGCSRPLVEAGWCTYDRQVGQTGCSVTPKLLVSLGVSGAIQHLAGTGGAETVVAVNTDPDAPIFGVSDYTVVGDCMEVVRELVALLEGDEGR